MITKTNNNLNTHTEDANEQQDDEIISKSQRKRDATAAQDLGTDLLGLSVEALKKIQLPENLTKAFNDARRIKQKSALKRQLQYIGKIMRQIELEPIREQYLKLTNHYGKDIKAFQKIEKWRDRLLIGGDKVLEELITEIPDTDRQHLRQLIRQSTKETKLNKPPKSAREVFKYLKILFKV